MSSIRNLWFDTRHLLGDSRGLTLRAELDALPESARATILDTGDELAETSLTLAQVFCRNAPAYAYIHESLENYPAQDGVDKILRNLGCQETAIHRILGSTMTINVGVK